MPKSRVWPDPLPKGTPVVVFENSDRAKVGIVDKVERWAASKVWVYHLEGEPPTNRGYLARRVRPLDMKNPDDVEVWLDGD